MGQGITNDTAKLEDDFFHIAQTVNWLGQIIQSLLALAHRFLVQRWHGVGVEVKGFVCKLDRFGLNHNVLHSVYIGKFFHI